MTTNAVPTPDEIWQILRETAASQKETDKQLKESSRKASREIKEFRRSQEEDSRKASREIAAIRAIQQETAGEIKETMQGIKELRLSQKETDRQMKKSEARFDSRWGRLMESLVEGDLVPILNRWGIAVENTSTRVKKRSREDNYEYDIIAQNGEEVVVVEVKTTLRVQDVQKFLLDLGKFTARMPRYKENTIYGAVAWLRADSEADIYAERQGLFIIRATGSSASIVNREDFQPQVFS